MKPKTVTSPRPKVTPAPQSLPSVFNSVEEAISTLKLDRRHKWYEFMGTLVYDVKYTAPNSCTGCDGGGCHECGYTGKRVQYCPMSAFTPNGKLVKINTSVNK